MLTNTLKTIISKRTVNCLRTLRCFSIEQDVHFPADNQSQERLLKLAVIGLPNAGKSTFINSLMDRKVCVF